MQSNRQSNRGTFTQPRWQRASASPRAVPRRLLEDPPRPRVAAAKKRSGARRPWPRRPHRLWRKRGHRGVGRCWGSGPPSPRAPTRPARHRSCGAQRPDAPRTQRRQHPSPFMVVGAKTYRHIRHACPQVFQHPDHSRLRLPLGLGFRLRLGLGLRLRLGLRSVGRSLGDWSSHLVSPASALGRFGFLLGLRSPLYVRLSLGLLQQPLLPLVHFGPRDHTH